MAAFYWLNNGANSFAYCPHLAVVVKQAFNDASVEELRRVPAKFMSFELELGLKLRSKQDTTITNRNVCRSILQWTFVQTRHVKRKLQRWL